MGEQALSILGKKILIIDDDESICELLSVYFEAEGYDVALCHSGHEAANAFLTHRPDAVLLDLMLPGKDGYDICRELRRYSEVPIIMLTARGETLDKVVGLELGADDYVVKPFEPKELIARVKAILRRTTTLSPEPNAAMLVEHEGLRIDKNQYSVEILGHSVDMPPKELELFFFLASHPDRVFTREKLLGNVWGYDFFGESRTVDVHIKRIREKVESIGTPKWSIKTVWRVGYKFVLNDSEG